MIVARTNDGRFGAPGFPTGLLPGQWRPVLPAFVNDPAGWMRNVKPFLLQSQSQFRSAGPFPLTSAAYATEFNQVKSIGSLNSATRTMFQTNSSLYWAENGARTWNRIFRTVSAQQGLTLEENARLFAMFSTVRWPTRSSTSGTTRRSTASGGRSPRSARRTSTATRLRRQIRTGCR